MIEVRNVCKKYGNHVVLNNISTNIEAGEKVVIIGTSGAGKSTFLRCLNLLETPDSGHILIEGQDITDKKTDIDLIAIDRGDLPIEKGVEELQLTLSEYINTGFYLMQEKMNDIPDFFDGEQSFLSFISKYASKM